MFKKKKKVRIKRVLTLKGYVKVRGRETLTFEMKSTWVRILGVPLAILDEITLKDG